MEDVAARTGPRHAGGPAVPLVPLVTPALVLPRLVLVLTARLLMAVLLSPALVLGPATPHCGHQWSSPGSHCRAEEVIVRGVVVVLVRVPADGGEVLLPVTVLAVPLVSLPADTSEGPLAGLVLTVRRPVTASSPAVLAGLTARHSVTSEALRTDTGGPVLLPEVNTAGGVLVTLHGPAHHSPAGSQLQSGLGD